jgi:superfamily II DNA or RNA helicase
MPCGSGKTVCFAFMARNSQAKGKTVWFLVHRRELLDQTVETFNRFNIPLNSIYIGMVATVANHLDRLPKPDFIIFDEAHHSSAATWLKIISAFPAAKICGLTATPCRLDGKPLGAIYDSMILGITAQELIQQGYLSPYRYYAPAVADLSSLKRKGADFDAGQATEILSQRAVFGDVIKHWRQYADGLQTICYCSSIKHSEATAEAFRAEGINAVHFDGNSKDEERKDIVKRFRSGEIKILCNVDLVGEGFDVPDCWCCILLRPTMSTGLFIQQSMRCMRPASGKTAIILDHVNNYQRHGLPDDNRAWSLTEAVRPRSEYREDGQLNVRQCTKCYFTFKTGPDKCPNCGAAIKKTRQEIENIKAIRLEEIKQTNRAKAAIAVKGKELSECRTLAEIMAWCKQNRKKPGYGYHVAKARGMRI